MKLGKIALKIRLANTRFKEYVLGAAEFQLALNYTLLKECAFVIPLGDNATRNDGDNYINQSIVERFAIVTATECDTSLKDKTGLTAYDALYSIRSEIFKAILGWQLNEAESIITYRGGKLLGYDTAWMWYQFEFEYSSRIAGQIGDMRYNDIVLNEINEAENEDPASFERIYTNYLLAPNAQLPYTGDLPLPDGYPDVVVPNIAQMINYENPKNGAFSTSFSSSFDYYDINA